MELWLFLKSLGGVLIVAILLRVFVIEPFKIPSSSMVPTLQIGDYILVYKLQYGIRLSWLPWVANPPYWVTHSPYQWNTPERGDVVVFTRPDDPRTPAEDEAENYVIKRVVGIGGDSVEVRGTQLLVNEQPVVEPYARWSQGGIPEGYFGPMKVPPGQLFLLGDNRDGSKDSRFWSEHFLDARRVVGRAFFVFWSWDNWGRIGKVIR
jgi:signal peptidase I